MTKTILLPHFSDTIAEWDVTVARLKEQYRCIIDASITSTVKLIENLNYEPIFIGSEFGNSEQTSRQVLWFIDFLSKNTEVRWDKVVICANNASRAKHEKQEHAKWSDCLLSYIKSPEGKDIYVVWVDDEVFEWLSDCTIRHRKVKNIRWNGRVKEDISQWSQFRSLEYRPLVQFILATYPDNEWNNYLDFEEMENPLKDFSIVPDSLHDTTLPLYKVIDWKIIIEQKLPVAINQWNIGLYELAKEWQLIGQRELFNQQRGIVDPTRKEESIIQIFTKSIESLQSNEIIFLGRDKFGNAKCLSKHKNWAIGIKESLNIEFGQTIEVYYVSSNEGLIEVWEFCITQSLGKETGKNCLRNGSSRWPDLYQLVELWHSYGSNSPQRTNNPVLRNLDKIPVGTKLGISRRNDNPVR